MKTLYLEVRGCRIKRGEVCGNALSPKMNRGRKQTFLFGEGVDVRALCVVILCSTSSIKVDRAQLPGTKEGRFLYLPVKDMKMKGQC